MGLEKDQLRRRKLGLREGGEWVAVRISEGELTGLPDRFDTSAKGRGRATLKCPDLGLELC